MRCSHLKWASLVPVLTAVACSSSSDRNAAEATALTGGESAHAGGARSTEGGNSAGRSATSGSNTSNQTGGTRQTESAGGSATGGVLTTRASSNSSASAGETGNTQPGSGGSAGTTAGTGEANGGSGAVSSSGGAASGGTGGASNSCGAQRTRLRVTNHCTEPLWLQHSANIGDPQSVRVAPTACYDFAIPDTRLESTRVWAKTGCDASGANCQIGQSVEPCPTGGCQPPIESKFEATFADPVTCPTTNAGANCLTWYNASQVDGYTLPFRITPVGAGSDQPGCVESDCAQLDLAQCPSQEDLSEGAYPSYGSIDLRVFAPNDSSKVIGCMSPCKKLNYPAPWGLGLGETTKPTVDFCCPTPPISSEQCGSGPVASSTYVTRMHRMCPSVYSYAYDDAAGLHTCPAQTKFEVVFCP